MVHDIRLDNWVHLSASRTPEIRRISTGIRDALHSHQHDECHMKPRVRTAESPLARDILDYLMRHPDAKDTVEGITQWWLLEQRIQRTLPEVEAALAELVERGLVNRYQQRDGRIRYRWSRQNEAERRQWLNSRRTRGLVPQVPQWRTEIE
jgi:predicted transcriptional regulator